MRIRDEFQFAKNSQAAKKLGVYGIYTNLLLEVCARVVG